MMGYWNCSPAFSLWMGNTHTHVGWSPHGQMKNLADGPRMRPGRRMGIWWGGGRRRKRTVMVAAAPTERSGNGANHHTVVDGGWSGGVGGVWCGLGVLDGGGWMCGGLW